MGRALALAVDKAGVRIESAFWKYESELSCWRLYLATTKVKSEGPTFVYLQIQEALRDQAREFGGVITLQDVRAIAPSDEEAKEVKDLAYVIYPGYAMPLLEPRIVVLWTFRKPQAATLAIEIEPLRRGERLSLIFFVYRRWQVDAMLVDQDGAERKTLASMQAHLTDFHMLRDGVTDQIKWPPAVVGDSDGRFASMILERVEAGFRLAWREFPFEAATPWDSALITTEDFAQVVGALENAALDPDGGN